MKGGPRLILKDKRIEKGMTQQEVADAVGLTDMAIFYYESGQRIPKPAMAKKLGELLDFDWRKIYEDAASIPSDQN